MMHPNKNCIYTCCRGKSKNIKKNPNICENYVECIYISDPVEYEKKCVELLKTYNLSQLNFVDLKEYGVDFLWDLDEINS